MSYFLNSTAYPFFCSFLVAVLLFLCAQVLRQFVPEFCVFCSCKVKTFFMAEWNFLNGRMELACKLVVYLEQSVVTVLFTA